VNTVASGGEAIDGCTVACCKQLAVLPATEFRVVPQTADTGRGTALFETGRRRGFGSPEYPD